MIETFVALAFAHVMADYVFQTGWMVERKKDPGILLAHIALVAMLAMAAIGRMDAPEILALGAAHLMIDAVKTYLLPDTLYWHIADQIAHFASVAAVAIYAPTLWATGMWQDCTTILHAMLLFAGLIFATRAGRFAIEKLMTAQAQTSTPETGLPKGGLTIGYLERGLIYALMLGGLSASIGFLIAAKSILRFGAVSEDRSASEYVIIGTLASFGWAILVTLVVMKLQSMLPPLEIGR